MADLKRLWRLLLPIALLALVIGTTTCGMVWDDHATSSPDACPICHLSHQAIEPLALSIRIYLLVPTGTNPEPQRVNFATCSALQHVPTRAPPA
jgi:hypothetical protein